MHWACTVLLTLQEFIIYLKVKLLCVKLKVLEAKVETFPIKEVSSFLCCCNQEKIKL